MKKTINLILAACVSLAILTSTTSCTTTTAPNGTTTTAVSTDPATQAAIAAAIQIATAAASTAISVYMVPAAGGAHLAKVAHPSLTTPAIAAAIKTTTVSVRAAQPSLTAVQVNNIVRSAYRAQLK